MSSSPSTSPIARDYALDAARGTLMVLGVFLHASNIYAVDARWLVTDPNQSWVFDWIGEFIHAFRMPAFFWISGYFCALTLQRYGTAQFLGKRIPRLLVPLLVTWATLNVLQQWLVAPDTSPSWPVPLYHLWFLVDLFVYFVIASAGARAIAAWCAPRLQACSTPLGPWLDIGLLAVGTTALTLAIRGTGFAFEEPWNLTSLYRLSTGFPFFFGGMMMFGAPALRERLLKLHPLWLLPGAMLTVYVRSLAADAGSTLLAEALRAVAWGFTWVCVAACLAFFVRLFSHPNQTSRFLSDASYTIYLFHHVLVFSLGVALLALPAPAALKYVVVVTVAFVVSAAIHIFVVQPNRPLRYAFNGK